VDPGLTVYEKPTCTTCRKLIALMAQHPELLQRPIAERGDRAVLARPVERVLELLD
jgi:arsenate reductase-like glutaredoxin family protein